VLLVSAGSLAAQAPDTTSRPAAGAYTDDQATRGEQTYQAACASCHTLAYHTDEQFRHNWFGRNVYELFKVLRSTMPEDNPGGLSDEDYARVIAYILKLNGFAAGSDSIPVDSLVMRRIRIGVADSSRGSKSPGR
jgi:S-disulfanyl-L-cysteine oxidoreductase SoxD